MYFFCNSAVCKITMGRHHTYFLPTPYLKLSTLNCLCYNTAISIGVLFIELKLKKVQKFLELAIYIYEFKIGMIS